ncbi:Sau3AI family type II restriction endonuclease [Aliarcobacter butzleri]|uniref:Sau3AI family type II restriction endonuclease n=1 Tax=Aliarcobacter butzleri TaxID=28197 RepID=UPI00062E67CA|nr:Sau3AI family type II restriction endonuclease [Aliarcobacter butzleri]KLD98300.1 hypothetical protein AF74_03535 [Aliarcobacter butzleri L349]
MIDYTNETSENILKRAKNLIGLTIDEILKQSLSSNIQLNKKDKGNVGKIIETYWFGMKPDNSPLPDFRNAGIELKVIPLVDKSKLGLVVKERTKICSIDYKKLYDEIWETSHAKEKLNKILFIYYIYNENITKSFIKKVNLWKLADEDEELIRADWINVRKYVENGNAHNLSEGISKILAASRAGSGGKDKNGILKDLVVQPKSDEKALKRAFSLKSSFTNQRWNQLNRVKYESILEVLNTTSEKFEEEIINKLLELENMTLGDVAEKFNIKIPQGKNAPATIVKKAIGFRNVSSRIKEFEQLGIQVKTIATRKSDFYPWEAVSFPTFKFKELINERFYEGENEDEKWEQCSLLDEINRILFIPILREKKENVSIEMRTIGKPFFWSPTNKELAIIKEEWENYIQEIKDGKVEVTIKPIKDGYKEISKLSKESDTSIIHIRPHGKDRSDRDEDHLGNSITKQCFWLNKKFLQKLLVKNYK